MNARRKTTLIAGACFALSLTACALLLRHLGRIRQQATMEDVLYVDSPSVVRRASLGYNGLAACIYWTRAVQYFGHRHFTGSDTYNQLAPLLEITTNLDPHLVVAYEYGASFLAPPPPNGAGQPDRAIRLMEYGVEHNPDDWRLYYDLGFVYYMEFQNYAKASDAFARGSRVPDAHPFMKVLAAQMAEHAGDFSTARMLWSATFQTSHDPDIRQNAVEHLRALQVDETVTTLQAAVTRFGERTGRLPASMAELAAAEHLRGIPADPEGHPYTMSPQGRILIQNPDDFPFITKGTPPGYKPPAVPKFHNHA
jgi:tetratricopeptide (TPR) repeat protein